MNCLIKECNVIVVIISLTFALVTCSELRNSKSVSESSSALTLSLTEFFWDSFSLDYSNPKIYGKCQTWIFSILASCVIGLSGVVPLLLIPIEAGVKQDQGDAKALRLLLSFAVGGLLGDVFLHLLPEAWNQLSNGRNDKYSAYLNLGIWILAGMFTFIIVEMMFAASQQMKKKSVVENKISENMNNERFDDSYMYTEKKLITETWQKGSLCSNGVAKNGFVHSSKLAPVHFERDPIHISGYLNLMANSIDNFTHGLAVAGSFLVGNKMGLVTTFAILIHEIPHEIGDFAILLRSGFHPWNAAKAQLSTASIGILGAVVALCAESIDALGECTSWILPFTSGGFLYIALVNVLPEILREEDPWESFKQCGCICGGIGIMVLVNLLSV